MARLNAKRRRERKVLQALHELAVSRNPATQTDLAYGYNRHGEKTSPLRSSAKVSKLAAAGAIPLGRRSPKPFNYDAQGVSGKIDSRTGKVRPMPPKPLIPAEGRTDKKRR